MYLNPDPGSSEVDWCESNYRVVPFVAEFFNTISNALFFVIPPIMIGLFSDFGRHVTRGIHLIWVMLIGVGIGSVYFHSTLSFAGQMIDELSILWILMTSGSILFPEKYLCAYFVREKKLFQSCFLVASVVTTLLACVKPVLNAYFLMLFILPVLYVQYKMVSECENSTVQSLSKRTVGVLVVAVTCWICDRVFCDFWLKLNIPYFHSLFHILIFLSANSSIVLFAYFSALEKSPQLKPQLCFWPSINISSSSFAKLCSVPYVRFDKLILTRAISLSSVQSKDSLLHDHAHAGYESSSSLSSSGSTTPNHAKYDPEGKKVDPNNQLSREFIYKFA